MKKKINVLGTEVSINFKNKEGYISLTDIAKFKNPEEPRFVIINWLRNRNTIEFLGIWEKVNNSNFNCVGFDTVKSNAGLNSFIISPSKWIELTNAMGIVSKSEENLIYATETDILNLSLFGITAKEWLVKNPTLDGNIRDYADVSQLVCLVNLENLNALFIQEGLDKLKRLEKLNHIAIEQMTILTKDTLKRLK